MGRLHPASVSRKACGQGNAIHLQPPPNKTAALQSFAARLRLSKKWLAPLFRGFHSSLAPTARPGSYAGKPLLRKAFCGFDAHVAKSDQSLRGGKAERRQWREERGGSPVSKGAPGRPHGPTQRDLCELHCGPRAPRGFSTSWAALQSFAARLFGLHGYRLMQAGRRAHT